MALVEFANGTVGQILGTTTYPASQEYEVNVHGNRVGITTRNMHLGDWHVLEGGEPPQIEPPEGPSNIAEDMVAVLRNGRTPMVDGREGRRSVELIQAIYRSAREGAWVNLPL
jgi:predicted dehydrogenase